MSRDLTRRGLAIAIALASLSIWGVTASSAEAAKSKPVSVFPAPHTITASDATTFSFRGVKPSKLGPVSVYGSKTGRHGGRRLAHSDGRGVSFIPKRHFAPGEVVKVYTRRGIKLTNHGDFWVKIGRFYGLDDANAGPGTPLPKDGLHSRPDLKPPRMEINTNTPSSSPGKIFFAPKEDGMVIADNGGRISWFRPTGFGGTGNEIYNFQKQTYHGRPVLTYWKGASSATGFSQIGVFTILNNRYNRIAKFGMGNGYKADIHEFEMTPRSTALVQAYRGVKWDLSAIGGAKDGKLLDNVVQEIDIKTGAVLFEWHSIGNVSIKSTAAEQDKDGAPFDYIHTNAIKMDGDSILVSGRKTSTIYRINRKTARVRWRLRGDGAAGSTNNFKMGPGTAFAYQHDIERLPNGNISLFDNGSGRGVPSVNEESSALVLKLSGKGKSRRANLVARYRHTPDPIVADSQGNAELLDNGNLFVGWGSKPQMTEFNPDGSVAFDATFKTSAVSSYRAFKAPWKGFPKDRPSIASEPDGTGATVWASWNGATVTSWKVFTGSDTKSLKQVGSSPWTNLETTIPVASVGAKVQVAAYDSKGKQLGKSGLIELGKQSR